MALKTTLARISVSSSDNNTVVRKLDQKVAESRRITSAASRQTGDVGRSGRKEENWLFGSYQQMQSRQLCMHGASALGKHIATASVFSSGIVS
jgi:hypothetical protein